jgi:hypothetical protein
VSKLGRRPAAIGTAVHNGWVILVTVEVDGKRPRVADRRRAELVPPGVPDNPFHHEGLSLPRPEAVSLVRRVQASVGQCARTALADLVEHVSPSADVRAMALVEPREVPADPADVLASRKLIYVADRHMYEVALREAASAAGIGLVSYARGKEIELAASASQLPRKVVSSFVRGLRATVGAPWRREHHAAAAAAIGALAQRVRVALR